MTQNAPESALGCPHFGWQYEGSWSRDGAFYRRRCVRCGRCEMLEKDRFFAAIEALAALAEAAGAGLRREQGE